MESLIRDVNAFLGTPANKFRVISTVFNTYDEVVLWAFNEFKIADFEPADTLEEQFKACSELSEMILNDPETLAEYIAFQKRGSNAT